jgi:hypothetical protein
MNVTIIKAVMSSAAEAKLGALFLNIKEAVYLRQILSKMGHPQPRTPIQTDNTTAKGVINNKKTTKMHQSNGHALHWICNQEAQGQSKIYWQPGGTNLANYFTKHHPPAHHVNVRAEFLIRVKDLAEARRMKIKRQTKISSSKNAKLQGCVSLARLQDLDHQILAKEKTQILHVGGFRSIKKIEFT